MTLANQDNSLIIESLMKIIERYSSDETNVIKREVENIELLNQKVKNNEKNALDDYLRLLKAGGSDYPVNLVKQAGVDLTKKDAFLSVTKRLHELVVLIEELLQND